MRRVRLLIVIMSLMAVLNAWSETIDEGRARGIAAEFMASRTRGGSSLKLASKAPMLGTAGVSNTAYYVFNATGGGYVIVAGDDRAPAVLGYSDSGKLDPLEAPEGLQELLDSYAVQMSALARGGQASPQRAAGPAIPTLLPAQWSQRTPFNQLLPFVKGKRAVVGCVGTAMAQVMHYWQWPARPTQTIPAYTSSSYSIYMPSLQPVDFNWKAMKNTYQTDDSTTVAAMAAATLCKYCDQSVEMNFENGSSSAITSRVQHALSAFFGYKPTCRGVQRFNYTTQQWDNLIYSELAAGRPVIYSGSKSTSGHAFICDGYDGNGRFHINWGWNGMSNGYFLLNVLNPDLQGTGSASGAEGYILRQVAIVGIEPGSTGDSEVMLTSSDVTLDGYYTNRTSSNGSFTATVSGRFHNYTSRVLAVRFGWGLYQGTTLKSVLYSGYNNSVKPGYYLSSSSRNLNFGSGLTSGTFRILPICCAYGTDDWKTCVGAEMNYIEVTINGNTCTIKGYGSAAERNYTVNQVTTLGTMHAGRPVDINVQLTNKGDSNNDVLYMLVNGQSASSALVSLEKGQSGEATFRYVPTTAGTHTLTFSWNDKGTNAIATRPLTITNMPAAHLTGSATALHVTSTTAQIITADKFSVQVTISNDGSTTYDEDITLKLYKHIYDNYGTLVQGKSQRVMLSPGQRKTLTFDMDNVMDGWKYFAKAVYYSAGEEATLAYSATYTIIIPSTPQQHSGDVNGDGEISVADVNLIVEIILGSEQPSPIKKRADVNGDGEISVADVNAVIEKILGH